MLKEKSREKRLINVQVSQICESREGGQWCCSVHRSPSIGAVPLRGRLQVSTVSREEEVQKEDGRGVTY